MRILIVTNDRDTRTKLASALRDHNRTYACDLDECREYLVAYDFDVIVIGETIDGGTSLDALRELRARKVDVPVILIVSATRLDDALRGFELGADDCIRDACHIDEINARAVAVVRRSRGQSRPAIELDDLSIDLSAKDVAIGGERVNLTGKEFAILEKLALRQGETITKEMFLDHLYGDRDEPDIKIIDVFICKLRRKLHVASRGKNYIQTVWGRGYRLCTPDTFQPVKQAAVAA